MGMKIILKIKSKHRKEKNLVFCLLLKQMYINVNK